MLQQPGVPQSTGRLVESGSVGGVRRQPVANDMLQIMPLMRRL
jgi:hypothetical protein